MLQRVGRVLVKLYDRLQICGCRMAFGQLGCAAGTDRTTVCWREPRPAIPLVAHYVPVQDEPFLVGPGRYHFGVRQQRRLHALGRVTGRRVYAVRVTPMTAVLCRQ